MNIPPIGISIFINIIMISLLLVFIEFIKHRDPKLIGAFAFVSGSFFFIQLLQYSYVLKRVKSQTKPFLLHSIVGFFVCFCLSVLLYLCVEYTKLNPQIIVGMLTALNLLIWVLYILFFKNLF
jgi:hypothetical protein